MFGTLYLPLLLLRTPLLLDELAGPLATLLLILFFFYFQLHLDKQNTPGNLGDYELNSTTDESCESFLRWHLETGMKTNIIKPYEFVYRTEYKLKYNR